VVGFAALHPPYSPRRGQVCRVILSAAKNLSGGRDPRFAQGDTIGSVLPARSEVDNGPGAGERSEPLRWPPQAQYTK